MNKITTIICKNNLFTGDDIVLASENILWKASKIKSL